MIGTLDSSDIAAAGNQSTDDSETSLSNHRYNLALYQMLVCFFGFVAVFAFVANSAGGNQPPQQQITAHDK